MGCRRYSLQTTISSLYVASALAVARAPYITTEIVEQPLPAATPSSRIESWENPRKENQITGQEEFFLKLKVDLVMVYAIKPVIGSHILYCVKSNMDLKQLDEKGSVALQLVPSGPQPKPLAILQLVLSTIYSAQRELIVTTPYFIPDDSVLTALVSAAHRGVAVTLIIPAKNDSRLAEYASRAVFDDLLAAGVRIARFRGGLLHTKSITVDSEYSLFGSLNLDMRSLWLNFEISLFIYNRDMTSHIRDMQLGYLGEADVIVASECRQRPWLKRFFENAVHLLAPLL